MGTGGVVDEVVEDTNQTPCPTPVLGGQQGSHQGQIQAAYGSALPVHHEYHTESFQLWVCAICGDGGQLRRNSNKHEHGDIEHISDTLLSSSGWVTCIL